MDIVSYLRFSNRYWIIWLHFFCGNIHFFRLRKKEIHKIVGKHFTSILNEAFNRKKTEKKQIVCRNESIETQNEEWEKNTNVKDDEHAKG